MQDVDGLERGVARAVQARADVDELAAVSGVDVSASRKSAQTPDGSWPKGGSPMVEQRIVISRAGMRTPPPFGSAWRT